MKISSPIWPIVIIVMILSLMFTSYYMGKVEGNFQCSRNCLEMENKFQKEMEILQSALDSSQADNQILGSFLAEKDIAYGRLEILYGRACEKLSPSEIREIESNIE